MNSSIVKVTGVYKSFGNVRVLKDISLDVEPGETLVVIGPSGSGKSTLLRCINLLEPINAGSIVFDGADITHLGRQAHQARREMGMVFQNFELFAHLTALENVALAPMHVKGLGLSEATAIARQLLHEVRIPEKAEFYPDELSGGQQQRVAIARALAMKPKVMLYDEPTSALDPEMIREVLDVIQDLARDGMTGIVVTHEMAFARRVADRVVFIEDGQIIDNAATADFFEGRSSERSKRFLDQILQH